MEKIKGVVTDIIKKTSAAGKDYYFASIGGSKPILFFDAKILDCQDKEIEIECTTKIDEKGTTYFGNFPGQAKSGGAPKRGSSPEELKQKAVDMKLRTKTMCFSYAKDAANHLHSMEATKEEYWATMDYLIQKMLEKCAGNIKELGE